MKSRETSKGKTAGKPAAEKRSLRVRDLPPTSKHAKEVKGGTKYYDKASPGLYK